MVFERRALHPSLTIEAQLCSLRETHASFSEEQAVQVSVGGMVTLVPLAEFEEEHCDTLYNYCVAGDGAAPLARRIFYDVLPASNAVLLFALPEDVCQDVEAVFGEVRYVSRLTPLLRRWAIRTAAQSSRRVYLYCRDGSADIFFFEEQRILVLNSYEVLAATDVVYYAFNLSQNLGVDFEVTTYTVFGEEAQCREVATQLAMYAPHVAVLNAGAEFNRHPLSQNPEIPFDLLAQVL